MLLLLVSFNALAQTPWEKQQMKDSRFQERMDRQMEMIERQLRMEENQYYIQRDRNNYDSFDNYSVKPNKDSNYEIRF